MRESEALGQLDDPAIMHVYDAGQVGDLAFRIGNWVDGEGLQEAVRRDPRPIPAVLALARDLLGALEHAHLHGIIVRAISPLSVLVSAGGRATVTDVRYCSYCLSAIPPGASPPAPRFVAPEIRDGAVGDPASDIYNIGAILYFAVTGQEPALEAGQLRRPTELRPTCPRVIERIVLRALQVEPESRYFTAAEMLEDFASDAGAYDIAPPTLGRRGRLGQRGSGAVGTAAAAGAGRRLRAAGAARHRRVRPGLPGPRPPARATGGAQGAASVVDPGPQRGRALPPRGAARGQARSPEHREHLRHRRAVGADLVHDGADRRPQPGAVGRARRAVARWTSCCGCCGRRSPPWPTRTSSGWCTATSSRRTC